MKYYADLKAWQDEAGHAAEAGGKVPQRPKLPESRHVACPSSSSTARLPPSFPMPFAEHLVPGNQQRGRTHLRGPHGSTGQGMRDAEQLGMPFISRKCNPTARPIPTT